MNSKKSTTTLLIFILSSCCPKDIVGSKTIHLSSTISSFPSIINSEDYSLLSTSPSAVNYPDDYYSTSETSSGSSSSVSSKDVEGDIHNQTHYHDPGGPTEISITSDLTSTSEQMPTESIVELSSKKYRGNRSMDEYKVEELSENPLRDHLSIAIPMTLIYSIILLSGLMGNISTCVVIAKTSYMHTATNYYLFSLAMSDLLLLISGLPQEIYHIWIKYPYIFGEAFCVIRGLAAETSANATVLTITAFTVERFVAIVYPLKSHKLSQLSRVVRMIGIIWLVAFCLALPQAAQFGVKDQMSRHDPSKILIKGAWCTLVREIFPYAFQISICVFFAIPMTIITVLYVLIGLKLRRSRKGPLNHRGSQEINVEARSQNRHSQSHVVRMLVAVVVAFFICWAPFHAQRLMALYGTSQETPSDLFMIFYQGLTHVSGILYYISTCINPILYHIMSNKFRQAFKDTMCCRGGKTRGGLHHYRSYSAMSHRSSRMGGVHFTSQRSSTLTTRQRDLLTKALPHGQKTEVVANHNHHNHNHPGSKDYKIDANKNGTVNPHKILGNGNGVIPPRNINGTESKKYETVTSFSNGVDDEISHTVTTSLHNSSPNEKDPMIPLTSLLDTKSKTPQQEKQLLGGGLRAFLRRNKGSKSKEKDMGLIMKRPHPSDPSIPSTYAVTILDSKGNSKTIPAGILRRQRTGSTGNVVNIVGIHKNTCRATSYTSVDSGKSNNTISNSSLQDMDETEYTGEELAGYMAELNHNLESPQKV